MSRHHNAWILCVFLVSCCVGPVWGAAPLEAVVRVQATIPPQARTADSLGTARVGNGIVIDRKGHVLTIGYLILEASRIEVTTADGKAFPARFVGYDHGTGFGLLQTAPPVPGVPLELGDSQAVAVGDTVEILTAGDLAVSKASVISRKEFVGYWEYLLEDSIYVAPAHPDYGGAALVAADGRLVGIGSILTRLGMEGVGWIPCNMFVPIDLLKPILSDLIAQGETGSPPRPWLGLYSEEVQGRVFVVRVSEGGPSAAAGLKPGDVLLSIGGQAVSGLADFYRKLWSMGTAGTKIALRVLQGDQVQEIVVESQDRRAYLRPPGKTLGEPI
jgi:S1-C subfamily serine protease